MSKDADNPRELGDLLAKEQPARVGGTASSSSTAFLTFAMLDDHFFVPLLLHNPARDCAPSKVLEPPNRGSIF